MRTLELVSDISGERLDVFLARRCQDLSRSYAQTLIEEGLVTVGGRAAKPSQRLAQGEPVFLRLPPREPLELQAESIPLAVVYRDGDVMVIDKPAGLTVHPAPGHPSGTLVNALLAIAPELRDLRDKLRPGIVHRLDKDTSGLMVIAKTERARLDLIEQMKRREVHKVYLALVQGIPRPTEGLIEAPIGRHPVNRKKMAIVPGGREAQTRYRVIEILNGYSLLELQPITGRTHQIRVHMAALGHPVVGDVTYGKRSSLVARQFLHAHRLAFLLPNSSRTIEFESPLPPDLKEALRQARADG